MPRYSAQFRNTVLKKLLPPESRSALSPMTETSYPAQTQNQTQAAAVPTAATVTFAEYARDVYALSGPLSGPFAESRRARALKSCGFLPGYNLKL